mgnify:CR=1 FL=1
MKLTLEHNGRTLSKETEDKPHTTLDDLINECEHPVLGQVLYLAIDDSSSVYTCPWVELPERVQAKYEQAAQTVLDAAKTEPLVPEPSPEPAPLPTVPPRVGGVYRTRDGRETECLSVGHTGFGEDCAVKMKRRKDGAGRWYCSSGRYYHDREHPFDLVAEISPPPEPAFTGPLEVGGWYECSRNRIWQCWAIDLFGTKLRYNLRQENGTEHTWCRDDWEIRANETRASGRIIRKVDSPGGES